MGEKEIVWRRGRGEKEIVWMTGRGEEEEEIVWRTGRMGSGRRMEEDGEVIVGLLKEGREKKNLHRGGKTPHCEEMVVENESKIAVRIEADAVRIETDVVRIKTDEVRIKTDAVRTGIDAAPTETVLV